MWIRRPVQSDEVYDWAVVMVGFRREKIRKRMRIMVVVVVVVDQKVAMDG